MSQRAELVVTIPPTEETFDSFEGAVQTNLRSPLAARAKADTERIRGSVVTGYVRDRCWVLLSLSNGNRIRFSASRNGALWTIQETDTATPAPDSTYPDTVELVFPSGNRTSWDPAAILQSRVGGIVKALVSSEPAVYLYVTGQPELMFTTLYAEGQPLLFWFDEEA